MVASHKVRASRRPVSMCERTASHRRITARKADPIRAPVVPSRENHTAAPIAARTPTRVIPARVTCLRSRSLAVDRPRVALPMNVPSPSGRVPLTGALIEGNRHSHSVFNQLLTRTQGPVHPAQGGAGNLVPGDLVETGTHPPHA